MYNPSDTWSFYTIHNYYFKYATFAECPYSLVISFRYFNHCYVFFSVLLQYPELCHHHFHHHSLTPSSVSARNFNPYSISMNTMTEIIITNCHHFADDCKIFKSLPNSDSGYTPRKNDLSSICDFFFMRCKCKFWIINAKLWQ